MELLPLKQTPHTCNKADSDNVAPPPVIFDFWPFK